MTKAIGKSEEQLSSSVSFDPNLGYGTREVWVGLKDAILARANAHILAGHRTDYRNDGGTWHLDVFIQAQPESDNPQPEIPVDRYELDAENVEADIWKAPFVFAAAHSSVGPLFPTGADVVALWKREVESSLKADVDTGGPLTPTATGFTGTLLALYSLISREVKTFEYRRPVLNRVRTYSAKYQSPFTLPAQESVYSTARLISDFNLPDLIAKQLPGYNSANPNPTNNDTTTTWGWKQRRWTSSFTLGTNKVEEVSEWVYDRWPNVLYSFLS